MKWTTHWWGVVFYAKTDEDKALLRTFYERLPKELDRFSRYEEGVVEIEEENDVIKLTFIR